MLFRKTALWLFVAIAQLVAGAEDYYKVSKLLFSRPLSGYFLFTHQLVL